ncbi:rubrerythrin [Eubacterium sp. CAG:192]|nr:rubrerythrin [Eubacterium sp. CAG:192]
MIERTGKFTVSVLSQNAQFELFKHFGFQSGRNTNKFESFRKCTRGENGIYYITEGTNAYISVTVNKTEDLGSHTMFIGEITDMEVLSDIPSATYEYYQNNIKPKPQAVGKTERRLAKQRMVRQYGVAESVDTNMWEKNCRMILYVLYVSTQHQILKKL